MVVPRRAISRPEVAPPPFGQLVAPWRFPMFQRWRLDLVTKLFYIVRDQ